MAKKSKFLVEDSHATGATLNSDTPTIGAKPKPEEASQQAGNNEATEQQEEQAQTSGSSGKKYVMNGAILKCMLCTIPEGQLMVTSNTIGLQGDIWATEADKTPENLLFNGTCRRSPFQAAPCRAVIAPDVWQEVSDITIQDNKALLEDSLIVCNYGGAEITIEETLQISTPTQLEDLAAAGAAPPPPKISHTEYVYYTTDGTYLGGKEDSKKVFLCNETSYEKAKKNKTWNDLNNGKSQVKFVKNDNTEIEVSHKVFIRIAATTYAETSAFNIFTKDPYLLGYQGKEDLLISKEDSLNERFYIAITLINKIKTYDNFKIEEYLFGTQSFSLPFSTYCSAKGHKLFKEFEAATAKKRNESEDYKLSIKATIMAISYFRRDLIPESEIKKPIPTHWDGVDLMTNWEKHFKMRKVVLSKDNVCYTYLKHIIEKDLIVKGKSGFGADDYFNKGVIEYRFSKYRNKYFDALREKWKVELKSLPKDKQPPLKQKIATKNNTLAKQEPYRAELKKKYIEFIYAKMKEKGKIVEDRNKKFSYVALYYYGATIFHIENAGKGKKLVNKIKW